MNAFRLVILVLVTYVLGLGTGAVGGVFLSYKDLTKPVVAATTMVTATVTVTPTQVAVAASGSPAASSATPSSRASTEVTSSESPSAEKTVETPTSAPSSEAASGSPSESATASATESATPESTSSSSGEPALATLDVVANKGEGYTTYVDGLSAGETPVTVQVVPNQTHKIKVVGGDKFTTWEGTIKLSAGEKKTVTAELKSKATPTPTPEHHAPAGGGYNPPSHGGGSQSGPPSLDNGTRRF